MENLDITGPAFRDGEKIPKKYTCQGDNINPEINIKGIPAGTKSIVIIMDDPDAPVGTFDHWISWNINPAQSTITENSEPGIKGKNGFGNLGYGGPCPPSGTHRYFFRIYALDSELDLPEGSNRKDLELSMQEHIIAQGHTMGTYQKNNIQTPRNP